MERVFVTGSSMAEVLRANLAEIEASDIHTRLGLEKGKYILLSAHREENIDTEKKFLSLHRNQPHGGAIRHADSLFLSPTLAQAAGRVRI